MKIIYVQHYPINDAFVMTNKQCYFIESLFKNRGLYNDFLNLIKPNKDFISKKDAGKLIDSLKSKTNFQLKVLGKKEVDYMFDLEETKVMYL